MPQGEEEDEKAENESRLYLARGMKSLPNDEVDDAPGEDKGAQQVPLEATQVGNTIRDPQHSSARVAKNSC